MKILQIMLKKDFIHQIMKLIVHYQKEKNIKIIGLMNNELGRKIITKFGAIILKTSYLLVV